MRLVIVLKPGGVVHEAPRGFEVGSHLGKLELDGLITVDGLAELLTFPGIADRFLQCAARAAERKRAGDDADLGQKLAQMSLAVAFLTAEPVAVRHEAAVE